MSDDLELVKKRKLLELQKKLLKRKALQEVTQKVDFYKVFVSHLTSDSREMFRKAEKQYPVIARQVAESVGKLFYEGRLAGNIDGRQLYGIFMELGYPIRLETRIVYKKRGEVKRISEMLKEED